MKKLLITLLLVCAAGVAYGQVWKVSDPEATPEAKVLFERLQKLQKRGIMFGHQDDLITGSTWRAEKGRSDTREAVGDYPAVVGFELGEIELGGPHSLDSNFFADIADRAKWFYAQDGVITVSWHCVNPISIQWPGIKQPNGAGSAWDVAFLSPRGENAVSSVLPGGKNHAMFTSWLDRLAAFFNTWRTEDGKLIPFLFRPYHEHSGSFFWWGRKRCYDEEYAELFRFTVDYLRGKGLHNILYMYNTDKVYSDEEYLAGYPGDDYCDYLSIDWYGSGEEFNKNIEVALTRVSGFAERKQKLFALSECGPISVDLQKILANHECSYVLIWRNAPRKLRPGQTPRPQVGPTWADLLVTMKQNKKYLFLKDIQKVK